MKEKIILASSSPRRIELLNSCNILFEIAEHKFDEKSAQIQKPVDYSKYIAFKKAESITNQKSFSDKYILGVDTIVVYKDKILGKPNDMIEAEKNIRMLSGKTHNVISGISIINKEKNIFLTSYSKSYVTFQKLDDIFIKYYLDNIHWEGYAGGYAIQGIFSLVVKKIVGSYSNIVGLPMEVLFRMLTSLKLFP
jgi:septum formation protein